LGENILILQVV